MGSYHILAKGLAKGVKEWGFRKLSRGIFFSFSSFQIGAVIQTIVLKEKAKFHQAH